MSTINPDRATDWIAVVLSTVVALSVWGIIVHQYITTNTLSRGLMTVGGLFVLLAVATLYGVEKTQKVLKILIKH